MRCQRPRDSPQEARLILARKLMLPDSQHAPARPAQCARDEPVTGFVCGEFAGPECGVVARLGLVWRYSTPHPIIYAMLAILDPQSIDRMPVAELNELSRLISVARARQAHQSPPASEAMLLAQISQTALPTDLWTRYAELADRLEDAAPMADNEAHELESLASLAERMAGLRASLVAQLADLRGVSLATAMQQLELDQPEHA